MTLDAGPELGSPARSWNIRGLLTSLKPGFGPIASGKGLVPFAPALREEPWPMVEAGHPLWALPQPSLAP